MPSLTNARPSNVPRRGLVVLAALFACALAACSAERAEGTSSEEASVTERAACEKARSEEKCLALGPCAWGTFADSGARKTCVFVGEISPEPGTGDPGGGGFVPPFDRAPLRWDPWIDLPLVELPR
jgi:hypothetical protein